MARSPQRCEATRSAGPQRRGAQCNRIGLRPAMILHYSAYIRTFEKVRISDEAERVQSVSYSHIRSLSGLYTTASKHKNWKELDCLKLTRLDGARRKKQIWRPKLEFKVFRKQMYCIEGSTCDIVRTFRRPSSHSASPLFGVPFLASPTVIGRSGTCTLLAPYLLRPWSLPSWQAKRKNWAPFSWHFDI